MIGPTTRNAYNQYSESSDKASIATLIAIAAITKFWRIVIETTFIL